MRLKLNNPFTGKNSLVASIGDSIGKLLLNILRIAPILVVGFMSIEPLMSGEAWKEEEKALFFGQIFIVGMLIFLIILIIRKFLEEVRLSYINDSSDYYTALDFRENGFMLENTNSHNDKFFLYEDTSFNVCVLTAFDYDHHFFKITNVVMNILQEGGQQMRINNLNGDLPFIARLLDHAHLFKEFNIQVPPVGVNPFRRSSIEEYQLDDDDEELVKATQEYLEAEQQLPSESNKPGAKHFVLSIKKQIEDYRRTGEMESLLPNQIKHWATCAIGCTLGSAYLFFKFQDRIRYILDDKCFSDTYYLPLILLGLTIIAAIISYIVLANLLIKNYLDTH